jgi:hypothetical protein
MKQKETRTKERNVGDGWFGVVKRRRERWEGDGGWEGSVRRSKCRPGADVGWLRHKVR